MNAKARVTAAINRQPSDRVALGFYVVDHDTIANVIGRPTYVRNKPGMFETFQVEGLLDEFVKLRDK